MIRIITITSFFYLFWYMLSGHNSILILSFGLVSCLISVYLGLRMQVLDNQAYPIKSLISLLKYHVYLFFEVVKANIDVTKKIIKPNSISPCIKDLVVDKQSVLAKVVYANSITLTPGTVTLELTNNKVTVHALSQSALADLEQGEMQKRIPDFKQESP